MPMSFPPHKFVCLPSCCYWLMEIKKYEIGIASPMDNVHAKFHEKQSTGIKLKECKTHQDERKLEPWKVESGSLKCVGIVWQY